MESEEEVDLLFEEEVLETHRTRLHKLQETMEPSTIAAASEDLGTNIPTLDIPVDPLPFHVDLPPISQEPSNVEDQVVQQAIQLPVGRLIDLPVDVSDSRPNRRKRKRMQQLNSLREEQAHYQAKLSILKNTQRTIKSAKEYVEDLYASGYEPDSGTLLVRYSEQLKKDPENTVRNFEDCFRSWMKMNELPQYKNNNGRFTLEGLMCFEVDLVKQMNEWVVLLNTSTTKEATIAMRVLDKDGRFAWADKNINAFKLLCSGCKVLTYDEAHMLMLYHWDVKEDRQQLIPTLALDDDGLPRCIDIPVVQVSIADIWLKHYLKAVVNAVTFNPRPPSFKLAAKKNELNTWCGFRYSRDDVLKYRNYDHLRLFFNHIRYTWCENDREYCAVIGCLASIIQFPWQKLETCPAIAGPEGSGKSIVFEALGAIIGPRHYVCVQKQEDLVGEFTAAIDDKVLIFLDECLFAGSQKDADLLKNLITNKKQRKRRMHKDPKYDEGYANIALASNHDRFLCVTEQARRILGLESHVDSLLLHPWYKHLFTPSPEERRQGITILKKYTNCLAATLYDDNEYGIKTLANFLYNLDLSGFDSRGIPVTMALVRQKIGSFTLFDKWWYQNLLFGYNYTSFADDGSEIRLWKQQIPLNELFVRYQDFEKRNKSPYSGANINEADFINKLHKVAPDITITAEDRLVRQSKGVAFIKVNVINLPTLQECRLLFNARVPGISMMFQNYSTIAFNTSNLNSINSEEYKQVSLGLKNRLENVTVEDLIENSLPEHFFGVDLRDQVRNNRFKVYSSEEWQPHDNEHLIAKSSSEIMKEVTKVGIRDPLKWNLAQPQQPEPPKPHEIYDGIEPFTLEPNNA
jgi:hypothetical protein